jgi:hypothetical protein
MEDGIQGAFTRMSGAGFALISASVPFLQGQPVKDTPDLIIPEVKIMGPFLFVPGNR